MTSWNQAIDRLFVHPERLVWLWLVGSCLIAIVVGEIIRASWRRRLFALPRDQYTARFSEPGRWVLAGGRLIALALVVLALADPRAGLGAIEVKTSKLQIVCLLDRSRSMMARDATPSRFEVGRKVVRNIVDLAGGAAVALATFAGDARIDVPLTRDYRGLIDRLQAVNPNDNLVAGTNIGAGLSTAATCFAERIESPKILVVFTDGETHGVEPELLDGLLPKGTQVLVLGVGDARQGSPIPLSEEAEPGSSEVEYLMHEGEVARSKANPEFLSRLAARLGGRFQEMDADSSSRAIAEMLRRAELLATEDVRLAYRQQAAPRFHWLLLAAVGLLFLEMILRPKNQATSSAPRPAHSGRAKGLMLWFVLPALTTSVGWGDELPATPDAARLTSRELSKFYNQGVQAYRGGRLSDAESLFRMVSRHGEGSLRAKATFNLANTQYMIANRGGISQQEAIERLEKAIGLYRHSIAEGRRTEDARANIEIAYRRLLQIQQQQPDSNGDGRSSPADQPPDGDDAPQEEDGDERDERGDSGDQPQREDGADNEGQRPRDGSGGGDDPSAPAAAGERPGTGQDSGDVPSEPQEPDTGSRSGSGRSDAGGPSDDPTEPLTDQQAEDQLRRIRERARDGRGEDGKRGPPGAAPVSDPPGLPW